MAEYIKREYAIDAVLDVYYDTPDIDLSGEKFEAAIRKIKAADVATVEVVRCKDCKYYCQDKINGVICRHPALDFDTECFDHWINTNPDDFCSYGNRKEDS